MGSGVYLFSFSLFFFSSRRRHTRYIGDWSSDVCSSDLHQSDVHAGVGDERPLPVSFEGEQALGETVRVAIADEVAAVLAQDVGRSEERRVGKEGRSRWSACEGKKEEEVKMTSDTEIIWVVEFICSLFLCFFFQAEDGIRDTSVTGVQTCALPICTKVMSTPALETSGPCQFRSRASRPSAKLSV